MNKKLNAKIQKLIPTLGENEVVFSTSVAIEPPEKELVLKKGSVYTVFDIRSSSPLNLALFTNVINDVLFDSYYHSESVSPIQSLEKAIVGINGKVSSLSQQDNASTQMEVALPKVEFNILAGVLWGNVLYVVQYGKGKSFLMREGEIKEVSSTSEGNFSVASGVVKSDDVIVLCTENFAVKFPPEKLLSTAIASTDLEPNQSCMILKFVVDTEFTADEEIDFNLPKEHKTSKFSQFVDNLKTKRAKERKVQPITSLTDSSDPAPVEVPAPIQEPVNVKIKSDLKPKFSLNSKTIMAIVLVLLVGSIFGTIIYKNNRDGTAQNSSGEDQSSLSVPETSNKNTSADQEALAQQEKESRLQKDRDNKVARVAAQPFYDIKLTDQSAEPSEIAVFSNTLTVFDSSTGKIYTSSLETPKFVALDKTFAGIKNVANYDGKLHFTDSAGFKIFDLVTNEVIQEFAGSFGVSNVYLGNIYSVIGTTLTKYTKSGDTYESSTWGENEAFSNTTSMDIAYSVYAVTSDGALNVFTQGDKADFEISGIDKPLKNPTDIVTDVNYDYVYIADSGNSRVVVIDSDGNFIKQIMPENEQEWSNIKSISVNSDETTLYVLSGSRVFDVNLSEALKTEEPAENEGADETPVKEEATTDSTADTAQ